jgi:hypothetical protein
MASDGASPSPPLNREALFQDAKDHVSNANLKDGLLAQLSSNPFFTAVSHRKSLSHTALLLNRC